MALTAYLTYSGMTGTALRGCAVDSGCDVVMGSKWGTLLGLPTATWGLVAYASLAATAFLRQVSRWLLSWTLAFMGVAYSAYLTIIALTELGAACPYCLTSFALMTVIFVSLTARRPAALDPFSWGRWLVKTTPVPLLMILALHLNYVGALGEAPAEEDPDLRALAMHIAQSGAKMYGAYWCPHCQEQKEMFGASAQRLPFVECSPGGPRAPQTSVCAARGVKLYPTWIINGQRTEAVMSLAELAKATGYQPSSQSSP